MLFSLVELGISAPRARNGSCDSSAHLIPLHKTGHWKVNLDVTTPHVRTKHSLVGLLPCMRSPVLA